MILRFLFEGLSIINLKKILLYGLVPVLLSSFWFIPFLAYSISSEGYEGYAPSIKFLFGFDKCCWGLQAGGIGVLFFLFIPILLTFLFKGLWKKQVLMFFLFALFIFGFLLFGGLGNHYPFGVDPVRFILPFSILLIVFIGLMLDEIKLFKNKFLVVLLFMTLIFGIIWNFNIINKNFNEYSYYGEGSRYKIIQEVINNPNFPIHKEFTNYRFGTSRYVFGETINYFMPQVSHNFGYQDAGMLNQNIHKDFLKTIYESGDINKSVYYFDWFGIKYFEGTSSDSIEKFKKDERFRIVGNFFPVGYHFTLFEYLEAKQIISLVDWANDSSFGKEKEFNWERNNPDKIIVRYDSIDNNDVVLFKEFYHKTWKAKDLESGEKIEINKNSIGFMYVNPPIDSNGIIFYQSKTFEEYFGIILSLIGIVILILYFVRKNKEI